MTLLQELQATIRAKSSSGGLSFAIASDVSRPEMSLVPQLGRSSHASFRLITDEMQRRSVRIAGSHLSTEVSYRDSRTVTNDLNS